MAEDNGNGQNGNAEEDFEECYPITRPNDPPGPAGDPSIDDDDSIPPGPADPPEEETNEPAGGEEAALGDERPEFRPIEQSNNFITEDKALVSPAGALARHKYMIFSNHYLINYKNSLILNRYSYADYRFPEYVYKLQEELLGFYDQDTGNSIDEEQTVPQKVRSEYSAYFNDVDPLLYLLGGYYRQPYIANEEERVANRIISNRPEQTSTHRMGLGFYSIHAPPESRHRDYVARGQEKSYAPFEIKIEDLNNSRLDGLRQTYDQDLYSLPGTFEMITLNPHPTRIKLFNGTANARDSDPGQRVREANLAKYIYGYFLSSNGMNTFKTSKENLVTSLTPYYNYTFKTDMPFFRREVEEMGTMKNLTVSINLESNFISTFYRNYGNEAGESERFLPSIYRLYTMENIKTLNKDEQEDYMEALRNNQTADEYMKKMLFTSENISDFESINNEFKGKVPMYVEFNIGTNQGSPLAEMLSKTGLDKTLLQFVSLRTLNRTGGKSFAEIIEGAGSTAEVTEGDLRAGERELFITEEVGGKTQEFDFNMWLELFMVGDRTNEIIDQYGSAPSNVGPSDFDRAQMSATMLLESWRAFIQSNYAQGGNRAAHARRRGIENPTMAKFQDVYNHLNNPPTNYGDLYFGRGNFSRSGTAVNTLQSQLKSAFDEYKRVKNHVTIEGTDLDKILTDVGIQRKEIRNIIENIDVSNFPLETISKIGQFDQFRMLIQALIVKGKIEKFYQPKFRKYLDLIKSEEYAYSETLMYRIDKHRANPEGVVDSTPVQSFYLMDSDGVENINFIDSQVNFGQRYIYKIYAYDFVVGTKYQYAENYIDHNGGKLDSVYEPEINSENKLTHINKFFLSDGGFKLVVNSQPCYKIVEVPYFEREIIVMDRPPMFPEVKFFPIKNDKNKFKIMLQATSGERRMKPIAIEASDASLIEDIRRVQGVGSGDPIYYESDDLPTMYQVYRTDIAPLNYSNFSGKLHHTLLSEKSSATDFYDFVVPNKKYYYTFRCVDKSINLSNPSIIYQVEMVDNGDYFYLDTRKYDFPKPKRNFKTNFQRFLFIKAAAVQSGFNQGETTNNNLVGSFGNFPKSIFDAGRKFKIRVKSKHSQRKFDINVSFSQEIKTIQNRFQPLIDPDELRRNAFMNQNQDLSNINNLYGEEYSRFMSELTAGTLIGSQMEQFAQSARQARMDNITNVSPGGGMGGGSGGYSQGG